MLENQAINREKLISRLEKNISYEQKNKEIAEGVQLKRELHIKDLINEVNSLRDQVFEVKKSNHLLKMELKGNYFN